MTTTKAPARLSLNKAWVAAHIEQESREFSSRLAIAPVTNVDVKPVDIPVSTPTVAILAALDKALNTVRTLTPEIPTALAVVISTGKGKFHGQFQASSWEDTNSDGDSLGRRHELLMSSESLARGGKATLVTLIHEAVHAQAHNMNVKDTSRQGRFHNSEFRTLAEKAGLICESDSKSGVATTGLQGWAELAYSDTICDLDAVLTTHRVQDKDKAPAKKTTIRVQCECGSDTAVTVPIKWYSEVMAETIICTLCDGGYFPVGE